MLTSGGARSLLKDVQFPGDVDGTYLIAVSHERRRALVQSGGQSHDALVAAAIEVQCHWRGFRTRCKLWAILKSVKANSSSKVFGSSSSQTKSPRQRYPRLSVQYHDYVKWCMGQGLELNSTAILSFEDYAARVIQSWWKHLVDVRPTLPQGKEEALPKRKVMDEEGATIMIQRAWRRYNDNKVFKFYRDLINFQGRGSPSLMLRCINPAESKLLDQASGTFVRFRLGGIKFPPNIYYKIFTHQPVVDMCSFSPREYTSMNLRQQLGRERHNKEGRTVHQGGDENWYTRVENNGWRPVSDRIFLSPFQDPITTDSTNQRKSFHHSKLRRRQDTDKKRKERKIEWLKKMYRDGALQAKQGLSEATSSAVDLATRELVSLTETHGTSTVDEGDIDELLQWTNGLNYDKYVAEWQTSASTAASDEQSADVYENKPT